MFLCVCVCVCVCKKLLIKRNLKDLSTELQYISPHLNPDLKRKW